MARNIWLISDPHLFHENSLKFTRSDGSLMRPGFSDVNHMNEFIREMWNSVVKQGDLVYCLGDLVMGRPEGFAAYFNKFRGSKRLVVGNHDEIKWLASLGLMQKIMVWRVFKDHGLILSHIPLHESSLKLGADGNRMLNVHGHIHHHDSPPGPYVNLSVEKINYTPVHIEEVRNLWKTQQASRSNSSSIVTEFE